MQDWNYSTRHQEAPPICAVPILRSTILPLQFSYYSQPFSCTILCPDEGIKEALNNSQMYRLLTNTHCCDVFIACSLLLHFQMFWPFLILKLLIIFNIKLFVTNAPCDWHKIMNFFIYAICNLILIITWSRVVGLSFLMISSLNNNWVCTFLNILSDWYAALDLVLHVLGVPCKVSKCLKNATTKMLCAQNALCTSVHKAGAFQAFSLARVCTLDLLLWTWSFLRVM